MYGGSAEIRTQGLHRLKALNNENFFEIKIPY